MAAQRILIQGSSRGLGLALVERLLHTPDRNRITTTVRDPECRASGQTSRAGRKSN